mmetsp:Transcript_32955/g.98118  ORF Transcript_32955/g.98118 Transcript_32955/m.98118 type:complete len:629 (-) Transcript_32955:414-2300(-)
MNNKSRRCHEVEGAPDLLVDAFRTHKERLTDLHTAFVLTHYHGDHYSGLPRNGAYCGPARIHCTHVTAELLREVHGISKELVVGHAYGEVWTVPLRARDDGGVGINEIGRSELSSSPLGAAQVTFLDANHCPGAAVIFVRLSDGRCHLHTGDMRYTPEMKEYAPLREAALSCKLDVLYLDTTYGHPKHAFPAQREAVEAIATAVKGSLSSQHVCGNNAGLEGGFRERKETTTGMGNSSLETGIGASEDDSTLILLSCYSIGKEKVLSEVSKQANMSIYANEKKCRMLECVQRGSRTSSKERAIFEASKIMDIIVDDPSLSDIHIISMGIAGELWPYFQPNYNACAQYALSQKKRYSRVVAFLPTGWADASAWNRKNAISRRRVNKKNIRKYSAVEGDTEADNGGNSNGFIDVEIRLLPYSEHSTFPELRCFVEFLRPRRIIPTVFSNEKNVIAIEKRFEDLLDGKRAKQAFFSTMKKQADCQERCFGKIGAHNSGSIGGEGIAAIGDKEENGHDAGDSPARKRCKSSSLKSFCNNKPSRNEICDDENLSALVAMGFDCAASRLALHSSGGNLDRAVELLLTTKNQAKSKAETVATPKRPVDKPDKRDETATGALSMQSITHFFHPKGR